MSATRQKRLALAAVALGLGLVAAANAHLVLAALSSQPDCVLRADAPRPARPAC